MRLIFIFLLLANLGIFIQAEFFSPMDQPGTEASRHSAVPETASSLVLLSEQGQASTGDKIKVQSPAQGSAQNANSASSSESDELCTMVGPYVQLLHAEYLVEHLDALGVKAQITNIEINDGEAFWVYLAPELSEKEALRRLYELQRKNIESYIITKGELANGISFGQYADSLEANERAKELQGQGYEAQIKSIPKTIKETWVVLEPDADEKISDKAWGQLLDNQETLEKRQNFCSGVASQ